jgi:putative glutamine amidotransferase
VNPPRVVIAVTPWLRVLSTPLGECTSLYTLDPAYAERVTAAGGQPTIVPHGSDPAGALAGVHGLVLSGGSDVHPGTYGSDADGTHDDASLEADRWELALLDEARRRGLPTFGICRGMQLLAVAHGGSLVQHVAHADHPGMGSLPPDETLSRRHGIIVEAGSRLASVLGAGVVQVNTIHHQAIADPGSLRVSATGPGGVIEAVEADDWPAYGVQWHPEKMNEQRQRRLFDHLVEQAASSRRGAAS